MLLSLSVPNMESGKLLLVDDKKENLLALSAILRPEGYELFEALSGHEAIALTDEHDFIAILMDVQMPVLNGFETAERIHQGRRNRATPIIFVTAIHRSEAYEQKGYDVGAVDYLFKPINTDILKAKVAIFSTLYRQQREIQKQAVLINERIVREKENELLKESLKARDQFLSMASHELKTPITPLTLQLQAFLQLIKNETLQNEDPKRLERMLLNSCSQVERLSKTIDNLLDVSRFTTGQMELQREEVNLGELVKKIIQFFSYQLKEVGCEVKLTVKNEVIGFWDPFRLEQIFINLLSNSMKYSPGKPIEILIQEKGGWGELGVKDYGIGIAPEDQERIFKRFERAVSPQFYGGLGLGLFITYEITRLHQGSIAVESELGQGATFKLRLPLAHSELETRAESHL